MVEAFEASVFEVAVNLGNQLRVTLGRSDIGQNQPSSSWYPQMIAFDGGAYAFDGTTYTSFSKITDASGRATFTLPEGDYRFRSDKNGTQFWSGTANHCTLPSCETVEMRVTVPAGLSVAPGQPAEVV